MALRFVDSFDHYSTAQLLRKYSATEGGGMSINSSGGRRGTGSLRLTSNNGVCVHKSIDAQATWIVGFSFRIGSFGTSTNTILLIMDGVTTQVDVRLAVDGTLSVTRNGTSLGSSAPGIIVAGVTNYIELKVTIGNAGSFTLRMNGTSLISGSGVDTQNTANATANRVTFGATSPGTSASTIDYDDLYICDGTGSSNNDFLGDVRVDCFFPNGNGNSSQLVGSDSNSVDNYLLVDETSPNDDTDYVQSSTVSDKDTYTFGDMSHSPSSIFGVQVSMQATKTDAGFRSIQSVIRSGGADTDGTVRSLASSYVNYMQLAEVDPATAAAWTQSGFNSAEFGAKVAA